MKSTQNLPTKLKELRKQNHYSQEYVAEQLNISRQAISHWENGRAYPDIDNLVLLAELYHISVDELLEDEKFHCNDEVQDIDKAKEKSVLFEKIVLSFILVLSSNMPFIGLFIALGILIWSFYKKRHYKLIYFLCFVCVIMGIHEWFTLYTYVNRYNGFSFIVPR